MRGFVTVIAASLAALALSVAPAWAGSSFTAGAEAEANAQDHRLTLTITEPDDEEYGQTQRVTVVAHDEFAVNRCGGGPLPNSWQCSTEGNTVTFLRVPAVSGSELHFTVDTPGVNNSYGFAVTQADEAEEPNTARSFPSVTVVGGEDPPPPPQEEDGSGDGSDADSGGTSDDSSSGDVDDSSSGGDDSSDTTSGSGNGSTSGSDSTGGTDDTDDDGAPSDDQQSASDSATSGPGSSTAPRRSEGRSTGTTLEITPGESLGEGSADTSPDDPAVAPPTDTGEQDADTGTATMTAIEGEPPEPQDDSGGRPWQQLVGALLLVTGGAVVALRRWDVAGSVRDGGLVERVRSSASSTWDRLRSSRSD